MFIVYLKMLHGNMKNPRKLDMLLVNIKNPVYVYQKHFFELDINYTLEEDRTGASGAMSRDFLYCIRNNLKSSNTAQSRD